MGVPKLNYSYIIEMKLYNLALQPSTAIIKAAYGNFSSLKDQQLILAKTKSIELYSITEGGKLELLIVEELFCIIRTIAVFRLQGTTKDCIIIGSDSGKITILEYVPEQKRFVQTHEETFGKSGCRRIVPGQHLAVDPRGRAFMIAAIEKQKFVYVLTREEDKMVIQSPRDAHKSHAICMDVVALDVGNENAMFVCLEIDYGEVEDKQALINTGERRKVLVYYEMDFGMNTVIRKKQMAVDPTAHMLIPVPGANEGPGGVLVVLQDFLSYRGNKDEQLIRFPVRAGRPANRKTQFTSYATYHLKGFFFLISSQLGDLFKVEFKLKENKKQIISIKIEYFDTTACLTSMALTKNGFLFCAAEKEDHILYTIVNREKEEEKPYTHSQTSYNTVVEFKVIDKPEERFLVQSDLLEQFGPSTDLKIADLKGDNNPQIYMLNASGSGKSYLRIIKQGLKVREISAVKYQKGLNIWGLKASLKDEFDKLIVISFTTKTIALSLNENGYSQTTDSGIDESSKTIHMGRLSDNSLIQVLPNGFRHIRRGIAKPMKLDGTILKAVTKQKQMVLALAGGDIIYYELNEVNELVEVEQISLDDEVVSMDLAPIQKGRVRSNFLVVALRDMTVRIFELSEQACLKNLSIQNMKEHIESIVVEEMEFGNEEDEEKYGGKLYIYTGLANGMLIRTSIDMITGKLTDSRPKYLGAKPVKCVKLQVLGKPAILALSSRPWLIYSYGNKQMSTLLAFPYFDVAAYIRIPSAPSAIIGFSDNLMKIIALESFGQIFHSEKIPLDYSGKKLITFKDVLGILETQRSVQSFNEQETVQWKSQITIFSPKTNEKVDKIIMSQNQACTAMAYCVIKEQEEKSSEYMVVACSKALTYYPKIGAQKHCIKVYKLKNEKFQFYHETETEDVCLVLHAWEEKILAGIGNCLRAYEIGKKKILRKAQAKNLNSPVNSIKTSGKRIFVTELSDSFHMYKYKPREQTFYDIADDILPRYTTVTCILDDHTMIGADKFENIFVSRVPRNAEQDFQNNPNTYKFQWQHGYLNGAPFKMEQICSYFIGEIVTSIEKASLATSGAQIIVYSTINGGIGALCPLDSREDVDFFTHVEIYLRNLLPNLSGRDHLNYRSYYSPCKGVVDGDLCEVYMKLPYHQQFQIGKHLDLAPHEIHKRLEEMRNRLI